MFAELVDLPNAVERMVAEYWSADARERNVILESVRYHRLVGFAPHLNRIMLEDPSYEMRMCAIGAAAAMRLDINLPCILGLAEAGHEHIAFALAAYQREECRPYLQRIFETAPPQLEKLLTEWPDAPEAMKQRHRASSLTYTPGSVEEMKWYDRVGSVMHERVMAAWGLAKLGQREAVVYLAEMLDKSDEVWRAYGCSAGLRAAQAMADIFSLPFEWHTDYVHRIRAWWEANREGVLAKWNEGRAPRA